MLLLYVSGGGVMSGDDVTDRYNIFPKSPLYFYKQQPHLNKTKF